MTKPKSHRHRAEVIEIYNNGAQAAVKFTNGRIECVLFRGDGPRFQVGQRGMVDYVRTLQGFEWTFAPFNDEAQRLLKAADQVRLNCTNDMQASMLHLLEKAADDAIGGAK